MKRLCAVALPMIVVVLTGCGSSSSSSSSSGGSTGPSASTSTPAPSPPSSASIEVVMKSIAFSPKAVQAKVGQTIKWANMDPVAHNVTHVSGPGFSSSSNFSGGGTFSLKLTQAGTIHYTCTLHPGMDGTVVVAP